MAKIKIKNRNKDIVRQLPEYNNNYNDDRISVVEESELGASLKQLNNDENNQDNMSAIDMRARLTSSDISSSVILDMLVSLNFLPGECINITKQKKRLSVSLRGLGRKEIVDIIRGEREKEVKSGTSLFSAFSKKE